MNCSTILFLVAAWGRGSREKGSCEGVRGCGRRGKSKEGGERVWKEDVRGEMRMWEGEGRSERRGKSAKGGGEYGTKEEDVRGRP